MLRYPAEQIFADDLAALAAATVPRPATTDVGVRTPRTRRTVRISQPRWVAALGWLVVALTLSSCGGDGVAERAGAPGGAAATGTLAEVARYATEHGPTGLTPSSLALDSVAPDLATASTFAPGAVWGPGIATSSTFAPIPTALADGGGDEALREVRNATRAYRDVDKAIGDGYVQFFGCVHEPLAGSMGIHFVKGALVGDALIDPAQPEALMYEVRANGQLTLVGVEYVVFQAAWDAASAEPPTLFGQSFNLVESPNRYGIDAFYELHAWAWETNPTGAFEDWNPQVLCPGTEGHTH